MRRAQRSAKGPGFSIILAGLVLLVLLWRHFSHSAGDTVRYRGKEFNMSKAFSSYEAYKDDPNNLATNELSRIENAITSAPFPSTFDSQAELARAVLRLKFPGYGCGGQGAYPQSDGSTCSVFSVEIPMLNKERYFVGRTFGKQVTIIDDFVMGSATNQLKQVKLDGTWLRYYDDKGTLLREKQM
jgi:hypothetical protein